MIDDANPMLGEGMVSDSQSVASTDEDHGALRTHLLQTVIRTRVLTQARQRLVREAPAQLPGDLRERKTIKRFKRQLYYNDSTANSPVRTKAKPDIDNPHVWIVSHPAPLPDKLAFLESVARSIGDDWCDDTRSFLDVTVAMGRLQLALRKVMLASADQLSKAPKGRALVTVPPGEEHQFAQCMIEELFRAGGWSTDLYCPPSQAAMTERIDLGRYDIVCLSWSTGALADIAATAITRIEQIPAQHRPAIIAGGAASLSQSGWLVRLGVDCVCDSTYGALAVAQALLRQREQTGPAIAAADMVPPAHR